MLTNVSAPGSLTLRLPEPARLRGRLVNARGLPQPEYYVSVQSAETGRERSQFVSDPGGVFELRDITPGTVRVHAQTREAQAELPPLVLAPGQQLDDVTLHID